ncbi:MAG: hypothetical protein AAB338_01870 [Patescibacteria group bacterium]
MHIKGLRNIKTHGSLAREGRLANVARNMRKIGSESKGGNISDGWSIEQHIYPKKKSARPHLTSAASLHRDLFLDDKVRLYQIEVIRDSLKEIQEAMAERIPVVAHEVKRLNRQLMKLLQS